MHRIRLRVGSGHVSSKEVAFQLGQEGPEEGSRQREQPGGGTEAEGQGVRRVGDGNRFSSFLGHSVLTRVPGLGHSL